MDNDIDNLPDIAPPAACAPWQAGLRDPVSLAPAVLPWLQLVPVTQRNGNAVFIYHLSPVEVHMMLTITSLVCISPSMPSPAAWLQPISTWLKPVLPLAVD